VADSADNEEDRVPSNMEATPVPRVRGQQCPSDVSTMEVDFSESGNEDSISVPLESEGNHHDYVSEEDDEGDDEEDAEEDEVDEEKVRVSTVL